MTQTDDRQAVARAGRSGEVALQLEILILQRPTSPGCRRRSAFFGARPVL